MLPSYESSPSHSHPPDAFVRSVAEGLGIPTADEYLRATRTAIISILKSPTGFTHLSSEVRELPSKMKITEPEDWPEARAISESLAEAFPENSGVRLKFIRHFIDETMPVDT